VVEAEARYHGWQADPAFAVVPALARGQQQITPAKFARLSQFLRHPAWEATNNGAERAGRAFRHRQGPHFNLRSIPAVEGALQLVCQRQWVRSRPSVSPASRSRRGRLPRRGGQEQAA